MKELLKITRVNRNTIGDILENHTLEQLNKVPEGFLNNLIWNIAHIVVTQQILVYKLSGLTMMIDGEMVNQYMKGSKVERLVTLEEVEEIKKLLITTIDQTEMDIDANTFKMFNEYETSTGFVLSSVSDAIQFNNYHEGIHYGYILALKKAL